MGLVDLSGFVVSVERELPAGVERVWELLTDLPLMASFSPEVAALTWLDSERRAFRATNARGGQEWSVTGQVLEVVRPERFVWCVADPARPSSTWSYSLTPLDEGRTRVGQSFAHGPGGSLVRAMAERDPDATQRLVAWRQTMLAEDMDATLAAAALHLSRSI